MRQLDAGARTLGVDEARDPLKRLEMLLAPRAEILGRDPPLRRDPTAFTHLESPGLHPSLPGSELGSIKLGLERGSAP